MMTEWKYNVLGLLSIALSLLAFMNQEYRLTVGAILVAAIVFYIVSSFSQEMEDYKTRIGKSEEKLEIYEQLSFLRAEVEHLKGHKK